MDMTIPIMMAGGAVVPGALPPGTSILDVPATVCWALGLKVPESFGGLPLREAFGQTTTSIAA
jgi:hypothetical protein